MTLAIRFKIDKNLMNFYGMVPPHFELDFLQNYFVNLKPCSK